MKRFMKKMILALAISGLVAGCASQDQDRGGAADVSVQTSGTESSSTPHQGAGAEALSNSTTNSSLSTTPQP
jgi:type IV pilus biogenesis protein CpaD/CtpE